jgi:hypothetical protein
MRWVTGAVAAMVMAAAAQAQECREAGTIRDLADRVLAGRAGLGKLPARNYGAEAVYLKLVYGALTRPEALATLRELAAAGVRDAPDAAMALAVTDGGLAALGAAPARALATTGEATLRAAALADPQGYFRLWAEAGEGALVSPQRLPSLVVDAPDDARLALARAAEAAGEPAIAAMILADVADPAELAALRQRHAGDAALLDAAASPALENAGASLAAGRGPVPWDSQPEYRQTHGQIWTIMRAAWVAGPADLLAGVVAYSLAIDQGAAAAEVVLAAIEAGEIDPVRDPESAWLLAAATLSQALPPERFEAYLATFDWPGVRLRHYSASALDSLAILTARQALAPVVGGGGAVPDRPASLPDGFDWETWTEVAAAVAAGEVPQPRTVAGFVAAVELLDAAGRTVAAADLAALEGAAVAMPVWRDLLLRLDRRCLGVTVHPGEGLRMPGDVLYKY